MTPKEQIIEGYKATDKNMRCRGFQFELGKWYECEGELILCENGFHFCEYPSGPWSYYDDGRIFKCEAEGVIKSVDPGSDLKHVCRKIRLVEEIIFTGDRNTGHRNTGHQNTGYWNTGDRNTGDRNTGYQNTGHRNTGDGNVGSFHSGDLNCKEAPYYLFDKPSKRGVVDRYLILQLCKLLDKDDPIDPIPFLSLPNATPEAIEKLHKAHIDARKSK